MKQLYPIQHGLVLTIKLLIGAWMTSWVIACATVKPAERGILAQPCMVSPFDGQRPLRAYENKVLQTLTGSELPAGAPGGGCGCVN